VACLAFPGIPAIWGSVMPLLAAPAFASVGPLRAVAPKGPLRTTPGEVLVTFASTPAGVAGTASAGMLRELAREQGVTVRTSRRLWPEGPWLIRYDGEADPEAVAARLAADPRLAAAGPNHVIPLAQEPNDPLFEKQSGLRAARFPEAWQRTRGAGVLIAVIDTGAELDHPDLVDRLAINAAEANGEAGRDDDGNGYTDDIRGYDFTDAPGLPGRGDYLERDPDPSDDFGHGTQVAGLAAATGGNGEGISGAAPEAGLLVLRAGFRTTLPLLPALLQEDDAAAAIVYATDRGADILNLSFGDVDEAPVIGAAIRYAREHGALVVAAAGNEANAQAFYPSALPGVFSVGASASDGRRAAFSSYGADLDLLAPGIGQWSTTLGGDYGTGSGTSFSAPLVCGAAALVWSLHREWTADQVASALRLGAAGFADGWRETEGWGGLDVAAAVAIDDAPPVVELGEATRRAPASFDLRADIAGAALTSWEVQAEQGVRSERVAAGRTQTLGRVVGTWTPAPGDTGAWVIRLAARFAGIGLLESRQRVFLDEALVGGAEPLAEVQGHPSRGFDLVVTWTGEAPRRGAVELLTGSAGFHRMEEATVGRHHAVRLPGPLPAGTWELDVSERDRGGTAATTRARQTVRIPSAPLVEGVEHLGDLPPGTPFRRPVDFDGDGRPEVLLESPPESGFYGTVQVWERTDEGALERLAVGGEPVLGIPVDVGDGDGDGLAEMIVFRVDRWVVLEARNAGEVPQREIFHGAPETEGVPLGFRAAGEGFLTAAGPVLRGYGVRDGSYASTGEAVNEGGGGADLRLGGARGDFDGDGREALALADRDGNLVLFAIDEETPRFRGAWAAPVPLDGPMQTIPGPGGRQDLLTVETDPAEPTFEGDLDRAATRVRRWSVENGVPVPIAAVALAGTSPVPSMQFVEVGGDLYLHRDGTLDRLRLEEESLAWGGTAVAGERSAGAVALPEAGVAAVMVWLGGPEEDRGTAYRIPVSPPLRRGGRLRVVEAAPGANGPAVRIAWEDDGCPVGRVERRSDSGEVSVPVVVDRSFRDTLRTEETVVYTVSATGCADRCLTLRGDALPAILAPRWDGPERLVLDLPRPLAPLDPPGRFLTGRAGSEATEVFAVQVLRGGRRLLLDLPAGTPAPDSLISLGTWDAAGLPLGGVRRAAVALPSPPSEAPPVLVSVQYRGEGTRGSLLVETAGDLALRCPEAFLLEPPGWTLAATAGGEGLVLSLPRALEAGRYRLSVLPECVEGRTVGLAVDVVVGLTVYPNPVRGNGALHLANIGPGSRVRLLDVTGRGVGSWRVGTSDPTLALDGVAPGLYLLRVDLPGGDVVRRKIAVVR